jgi:hypothetical protein
MMDPQFPIVVICPWCERGETLANKTADINVSCQCNRCGNYYHIDFTTGRAKKAKPKPQPKTNPPGKNTRKKTE